MSKHLILFIAFLALLLVILYHPIPDPDLWAPAQLRENQEPRASAPDRAPPGWEYEPKAFPIFTSLY
ncbi:MAG: hypothetical protein AAFW73_27030 [Bacteroidota bacterium]